VVPSCPPQQKKGGGLFRPKRMVPSDSLGLVKGGEKNDRDLPLECRREGGKCNCQCPQKREYCAREKRKKKKKGQFRNPGERRKKRSLNTKKNDCQKKKRQRMEKGKGWRGTSRRKLSARESGRLRLNGEGKKKKRDQESKRDSKGREYSVRRHSRIKRGPRNTPAACTRKTEESLFLRPKGKGRGPLIAWRPENGSPKKVGQPDHPERGKRGKKFGGIKKKILSTTGPGRLTKKERKDNPRPRGGGKRGRDKYHHTGLREKKRKFASDYERNKTRRERLVPHLS